MSSICGLGEEVQRRNWLEALRKAIDLWHELKLLRWQINPYFLFNALNNLYAIVQFDPMRAGKLPNPWHSFIPIKKSTLSQWKKWILNRALRSGLTLIISW